MPSHDGSVSSQRHTGAGAVVRSRTRSMQPALHREVVGLEHGVDVGLGASRATSRSARPSGWVTVKSAVSLDMPLPGSPTSLTTAPAPDRVLHPALERGRGLRGIATPRRRHRVGIDLGHDHLGRSGSSARRLLAARGERSTSPAMLATTGSSDLVLATGLALGAAVLHAAWNLLIKTAADRDIAAWGQFVFGGVALLPVLLFTGRADGRRRGRSCSRRRSCTCSTCGRSWPRTTTATSRSRTRSHAAAARSPPRCSASSRWATGSASAAGSRCSSSRSGSPRSSGPARRATRWSTRCSPRCSSGRTR